MEQTSRGSALLNNLLLLGFSPQAAAKGIYEHIKFDECMFTHANNTKAFVATSHFLFNKLDPKKTQATFRHCWPLIDFRRQSRLYIAAAFRWLEELRRDQCLSGDVTLRRSYFEDCRGDKVETIMASFSTYVLKKAHSSQHRQQVPSTCNATSSTTATATATRPATRSGVRHVTATKSATAAIQSAAPALRPAAKTSGSRTSISSISQSLRRRPRTKLPAQQQPAILEHERATTVRESPAAADIRQANDAQHLARTKDGDDDDDLFQPLKTLEPPYQCSVEASRCQPQPLFSQHASSPEIVQQIKARTKAIQVALMSAQTAQASPREPSTDSVRKRGSSGEGSDKGRSAKRFKHQQPDNVQQQQNRTRTPASSPPSRRSPYHTAEHHGFSEHAHLYSVDDGTAFRISLSPASPDVSPLRERHASDTGDAIVTRMIDDFDARTPGDDDGKEDGDGTAAVEECNLSSLYRLPENSPFSIPDQQSVSAILPHQLLSNNDILSPAIPFTHDDEHVLFSSSSAQSNNDDDTKRLSHESTATTTYHSAPQPGPAATAPPPEPPASKPAVASNNEPHRMFEEIGAWLAGKQDRKRGTSSYMRTGRAQSKNENAESSVKPVYKVCATPEARRITLGERNSNCYESVYRHALVFDTTHGGSTYQYSPSERVMMKKRVDSAPS